MTANEILVILACVASGICLAVPVIRVKRQISANIPRLTSSPPLNHGIPHYPPPDPAHTIRRTHLRNQMG